MSETIKEYKKWIGKLNRIWKELTILNSRKKLDVCKSDSFVIDRSKEMMLFRAREHIIPMRNLVEQVINNLTIEMNEKMNKNSMLNV